MGDGPGAWIVQAWKRWASGVPLGSGSEEDGGLTTYAPMALGKELRGEGLEGLGTSLKGYFSEPYGCSLMALAQRCASTGT